MNKFATSVCQALRSKAAAATPAVRAAAIPRYRPTPTTASHAPATAQSSKSTTTEPAVAKFRKPDTHVALLLGQAASTCCSSLAPADHRSQHMSRHVSVYTPCLNAHRPSADRSFLPHAGRPCRCAMRSVCCGIATKTGPPTSSASGMITMSFIIHMSQ